MKQLKVNSFAKLNLYLEVLRLRKDGYHDIKSLFERINLTDKITLCELPEDKIIISCNSPLVPKNENNLAYKSAQILKQALKIKTGIHIKIDKRLPVGSGMGAGSGNAAAVLLGLNKLWRLKLSRNKLIFFAQKIGADVAFFVLDRPFALGLGRGDRLKSLQGVNQRKIWHIIVVPKLTVSTPFIYKEWDKLKDRQKLALTKPKPNVKLLTSALLMRSSSSHVLAKGLFNSLEEVTAGIYPQISIIKEKLKALKVNAVMMSGSGPTVFGVVHSKIEAFRVKKQLGTVKGWSIFVACTY